MGRAEAMTASASSGVVFLGSARAAVARNGDEKDVPPLFAPPDDLHVDSGRGLRELAEIAVDLGRTRELSFGPDDVAEILGRRGHRVGGRHIGDPGIAEAGISGEFRDGLDGARLWLVRGVGVLVLGRRGGKEEGGREKD
jgi:hypothetical protein